MDNINKNLYIPLYGKALVSRKGIILTDKKAEEIWDLEQFEIKGKAKSKWLAYFMAMRSAVVDQWVRKVMAECPDAVVLHIGCGMDCRCDRIGTDGHMWYDIDFENVIEERKKYFEETDFYKMLSCDMRDDEWESLVPEKDNAIVVLEGVSMYFNPEELKFLLSHLTEHFKNVRILMDCYTERGTKVAKYKNPISDIEIKQLYGYDEPKDLEIGTGLTMVKERSMTPSKLVDQMDGTEKQFFQTLMAGDISKSIYRMYEYESN